MLQNALAAAFWILHQEDQELKHIPEITRLDIFDGISNDFHDDGLFSTRIFGAVGSQHRDWNFGKINLKVRVFHPKIYKDLLSLKQLYGQIIEGKRTAIFDESILDFVASSSDEADTGYSFFAKHCSKIEFRKNNSISRNSTIDFLNRWRHRWFTKNFVVMPAGWRDVEKGEDDRPTKHEINDYYVRLLAGASTIAVTSNMESPAYDVVRVNLTRALLDLYLYLEPYVGGKSGWMREKFISRRTMDSTRNVLTSMNTSGVSLDAPNVPSFDSTVVGLYQASVAINPKVIHWLKTGLFEPLLRNVDGDVPLVDPKTYKTVWVDLKPHQRLRWLTDDGLRKLIESQSDFQARHKPVMIAGKYLALIYIDDNAGFKILRSIDELPEGLNKDFVHPITLEEVIYLSGYREWTKHYGYLTRYPVAGDDSMYPGRMYVKTTSTGEIRHELDDEFKRLIPPYDDPLYYTAVEFPRRGLTSYHDSLSPAPSRIGNIQGDFDGDTGSLTGLMMSTSLDEITAYLRTRAAWVTPSGKLRAELSYDTADLIFRNLTGRWNHVGTIETGDVRKALHAV